MALLGSGRRGERVSLYFFYYVVTKLQKAGNPYQYRISDVTESVTQPCGYVTNTTGHGVLLRFFGRFAGKNLNNKIHPAGRNQVRNKIRNRRSATADRIVRRRPQKSRALRS